MGLTLKTMTVDASSRKLHAHFTPESEDDARSLYGIDLQSELVSLLSDEIVREQDREVLERIEAVAAPSTYDFATSSGRYHAERFTSLGIQISKLSNDIAIDSKSGPATFIVVSPNLLTALAHMNAGSFQPAPLNVASSTFAGTLNGNIRVYVDVRATSEKILIGRRGTNGLEAGIILASYIPLEITGRIIDSSSLDAIVGVRTRYSVVETPFASKYYRLLTVTNLNLN